MICGARANGKPASMAEQRTANIDEVQILQGVRRDDQTSPIEGIGLGCVMHGILLVVQRSQGELAPFCLPALSKVND